MVVALILINILARGIVVVAIRFTALIPLPDPSKTNRCETVPRWTTTQHVVISKNALSSFATYDVKRMLLCWTVGDVQRIRIIVSPFVNCGNQIRPIISENTARCAPRSIFIYSRKVARVACS